ncbi:MAG: lipoprotein signal peptidase [Porphyromonadaceae bacterium]|nr:lipoprotein signal peptidase [Porphyromonadaceae bacterium]
MTQRKIALFFIFLLLIVDQVLKIWIKTHFTLGESLVIYPWFRILFVENNGMAFGIEILGKLFLSVFRIVAIGVIAYYLCKLIRAARYKTGFIICISLILAGAIGNIIDSLFYGLIFTESTYRSVAVLTLSGGGYAPFLFGKVVDMLYFPLFGFYWPQWMPFLGGEYFEFFRPIFNISDSAISVGVILLILFYRRTFSKSLSAVFPKRWRKNNKRCSRRHT